ncbi:CocE/NonD family hydrolase [Gracilibacillus caseinilyticus]|uniref:CocE/NonD family hydrolase n=1 Tax=Gracilibacillus caseinilyticus TaxID=2932256 RepID=A0ABY4F0Y5_9BACI|nr:CocE/NonD family hydrolase [Gracilibacillus caseinilyticus]UOQ49876.1 CocE/NonD family hydrolase [Gracilibacillus caseinilyticus]
MEQIIVDREVPCELRDGVKLYANIYRPSDEGTYPVLLCRLPYNKNLPDFSHRYVDPFRLAMSGYIVIIQDVRGRFASEGEFRPFAQEVEDGYDAVEWAAALPYSNGKVGMFGLSYYGFTQIYGTLEQPPSLKVIFPAMTGNITGDAFNQNGVFQFAASETWILDSVAMDYLKRKQTAEQYTETVKEIIHDLNHIEEWHDYKPVQEWPPVMKHPELRDLFEKYINNQLVDEVKNKSYNHEQALNLPAFHLAGWYDNFLNQTILNYEDMSKLNDNQKLIIGPWAHGMFHADIGERSFGISSSGYAIDGKEDITSLHIKWFDRWLKGKETTILDSKDPVHIFTMGTNTWRSEPAWPIPETQYTPFYLHSDGEAHQTSGSLSTEMPGEEKVDTFVYDPHNPVPTNGGGVLFYNGRNAGPRDQSVIEQRDDVLVYTSEPLTDALEVTGWIKANIWASSDAPDTDFTVKLVDVAPDGTAYNLADGIVRAKWRNGSEEAAPLTGEIVEYELDLWATSNVFLPGHAIRIEVSSSNYPWYDVNPNTGETLMTTDKMVTADQVIYHDSEHPSSITLPVIPKSE